ncbi:hypothetical protein ACFE04_008838 [Oxalis oulophora]
MTSKGKNTDTKRDSSLATASKKESSLAATASKKDSSLAATVSKKESSLAATASKKDSSLASASKKDNTLANIASKKESSQVDSSGGNIGGGPPPGGSSGPQAGTPAPGTAPNNAPEKLTNNNAPGSNAPGQPDHLNSRSANNTVMKSGPLFISSKGIGWTSWKKRWFILTRTSLVFFRSDPSAIPQRGSEVNLTLGGIDLNNSGSVEIKAEKKLLTVLFPDGRDGRAFTLKAPHVSSENNKQQPGKSVVVGRPILLALEEVDGTPSFLEKALKFIEEHGVKVEGILRQAADVDDVEHRIREYEKGNTEFLPGEDAHVIGDCVKYVIRELPSSPVPLSCCRALLDACKTDRSNRLNAMRTAICETFPEPNRRLLQRILSMMQVVASHKAVNRMSTSAVAACMAPLLLRPLLAGDCEIENDFDVGGDGSMQLLQAAAAANHAQAICITLLEEYNNIFMRNYLVFLLSFIDWHALQEGSEAYTDDDLENGSAVSYSESGDSIDNELDDDKGSDKLSSGSKSNEVGDDAKAKQKALNSNQTMEPQQKVETTENVVNQRKISLAPQSNQAAEKSKDGHTERSSNDKKTSNNPADVLKSTTMSNELGSARRRNTVWGRTSARKNLSMESIDFTVDDEDEIEALEAAKCELQSRIAEEVKGNAALQENLDNRRKELLQRRLALENEVVRLEEQLQKEKDKRKSILDMSDEKTKEFFEELSQAEVDVISLKLRVDNLAAKLTQQIGDLDNQTQPPENQKVILDIASAALLLTGKSTSKDTGLDGEERGNDKKNSSNKPPRSTTEQVGPKLTNSSSKGKNTPPSALMKLTNRLNFIKERRSQLAILQQMDKGSSNSSEEKAKLEIVHPGESGEGQGQPAVKYSERFKNSPSLAGITIVEDDKRPENQNPHILERGRSEGNLSYNPEDVGLGAPNPKTTR